MAEKIAYIAIGSNLGARERTLTEALKRIDRLPGTRIVRISQFLKTEPVGGPAGQGAYLNGVVEVRTSLEPVELLHVLQGIEKALGRDRPAEQRWGPRTCDLDILLMGDVVMESEELTIPHPRMHERLFVLEPLAEIGPETEHPVLKKTVGELLAEARTRRK